MTEHADLMVLQQQPPHKLNAAERHHAVNLGHEVAALGERHERRGMQHLARFAAQARRRLVIADLALR